MLTKSSSKFSIIHGDCVSGMRTLPPSSIDVVVTSPPYNIGIKYSLYKDAKKYDDYLLWCEEWSCEIARLLAADGSFFLNLGTSSGNPLFPFEVAKVVGKTLHLQNTIHWIKSISLPDGHGGFISRGHFKPINSARYINDCHEYVFHFTKKGFTKLDKKAVGVPYQDKSNIGRWGHTNGVDRRCRGNTWFIPYKTINRRDMDRPHPATFPAELAEKCIRLHGKSNCRVLDPFLGIGNAAAGALDSGMVKEFIGFDIDRDYLEVACSTIGCNMENL